MHFAAGREDPRFEGTALRVPAGTLRDRPTDALSPAELCLRHAAYRHRVMMGPGYRADAFAALAVQPNLRAAESARRTYSFFVIAWQVKRDSSLIQRSRQSTAEAAACAASAPGSFYAHAPTRPPAIEAEKSRTR